MPNVLFWRLKNLVDKLNPTNRKNPDMQDELFTTSIGLAGWHVSVNEIKPAEKLHRATDFDTARKAARSASKRGPSQRDKVLLALHDLKSATDYELGEHCGILRSSAAKRRQELQEMGLVKDSNERRKTDTGTLAIVWTVA